jgi:hypothetical protein
VQHAAIDGMTVEVREQTVPARDVLAALINCDDIIGGEYLGTITDLLRFDELEANTYGAASKALLNIIDRGRRRGSFDLHPSALDRATFSRLAIMAGPIPDSFNRLIASASMLTGRPLYLPSPWRCPRAAARA